MPVTVSGPFSSKNACLVCFLEIFWWETENLFYVAVTVLAELSWGQIILGKGRGSNKYLNTNRKNKIFVEVKQEIQDNMISKFDHTAKLLGYLTLGHSQLPSLL